jgi:hypothetical protein
MVTETIASMSETVASVATLGGFIWTVRIMLPKALKDRDPLAFGSAVLTALVALLAWLLIGVRVVALTRSL